MTAKISSYTAWLWIAIFVAFIAYTIPWVVSRASGLTFNAYDFAEWATLHPEVRATSLLITSLLLRLQLTWIAAIIAINIPQPRYMRVWCMSVMLVVLMVIALLPPLEFFFEARNDGNYQQQFGVAIITLIAGIISLNRRVQEKRWILTISAAIFGILTSAIGLVQGLSLFDKFGLNPQLGTGGILMIIVYAAIVTLVVYHVEKSKQGGTTLRAALLNAT